MPSEAGTYSEKYGLEYQSHILAVLARTPTAVARYRSAIDYKYFVSDVAREIAKVLFAHIDEHSALPTQVTLKEELKEAVEEDNYRAVSKMVSKIYKEDISDAEAVLKTVVQFGKQQAMVNAVIKSADYIDAGKREKVLGEIHQAQLVGEDLLDKGIHYNDSSLRYEWYQTVSYNTIPTGITHLDYALDGGLSRGELGVVLAPPKRGKSTLLVNIGFGALLASVSERYNVVHYSLEMSESKIAKRYDDRLAGKATAYKKSNPNKYHETLSRRANKFIRGNLFIKNYPTRSAPVSSLRSHLSMLAAEGINPDLVIVDYADILKAERRIGDMRHEQAGIYEDLRTLAGDFNCAGWTASQSNKGGLDKETIDMGDFAESFEKAAVMDAGIAFSQTQDEKIGGECRLFLMGVRDAEDNRTIRCNIRRDRCLIKSTRLVDAQGVPIATPSDDEEELDAETETAKRQAASRKAKENNKRNPKRRKKKLSREVPQ